MNICYDQEPKNIFHLCVQRYQWRPEDVSETEQFGSSMSPSGCFLTVIVNSWIIHIMPLFACRPQEP